MLKIELIIKSRHIKNIVKGLYDILKAKIDNNYSVFTIIYENSEILLKRLGNKKELYTPDILSYYAKRARSKFPFCKIIKNFNPIKEFCVIIAAKVKRSAIGFGSYHHVYYAVKRFPILDQ